MVTHQRRSILSVLSLILFVIALCLTKPNHAHSPHDPIDALALSPIYDQDQTVFVAISAFLRKSTDGGFSWQELVNGLDHKSLLSEIVVSPSYAEDKTVYVASKGDGIYRSQDRGLSWQKVNTGLGSLEIASLAIYSDYLSNQIVLAASMEGGLYRTENGGEVWEMVVNEEVRVTSMAFFTKGQKNLALIGDEHGNIYLSDSSGRDWDKITRIESGGAITAIAVSPNVSHDQTVFLGTEKSAMLKSVDGGKTFKESNQGLESNAAITSVRMSSNYSNDSIVIASTWYDGVYISQNGGDNWEKFDNGLTKDKQADSIVYRSPHFRDVSISNAFGKNKVVFVGGYDGLFRSNNGGVSWRQLETLPLKVIKGLGVSKAEQGGLAVGIATYGGGAYITEKTGQTWTIMNNGLINTRLSDIELSPTYMSDHTVFSGASGRLLKSMDRGRTWIRNDLSLHPWKRKISGMLAKVGLVDFAKRVLPPSDRRPPYPTRIAISPTYSADSTLFFGTRSHGIFRSLDGGETSAALWNSQGEAIVELALSPNYKNDQTVFTSVRGRGVYKSDDGGITWNQTNNGLDFLQEWQGNILHQLKVNDILMAISPNYGYDQTVYAASSQGLYKTIDGGKYWKKVDDMVYGRNGFVKAVAVSPAYSEDQTVLISIKGRGLYITHDGGGSFMKIASDLIKKNHELDRIHFSPQYATDKTVYASSYETLFVSQDGGNQWRTIKRPVRYENHREVVRYEGNWEIKKGEEFSATKISCSANPGDQVTLDFVGSGVNWLGTRSDTQGIARIYLDGKYQGEIDQFAINRETMVEVASIEGLPYGAHNLRVEVIDKKHPDSEGNWIEIDAFDVLP